VIFLKKLILSVLSVSLLLILGYFGLRFKNNRDQIKPYPYVFSQQLPNEYDETAPILIIGDRQATRLASFSKLMAQKVSEQLSKPIKITSLATKGEGLHRTLQRLKQLDRLPLITIYLGGNEEYYESKFNTEDIDRINLNFKKYSDPMTKTLFIVFPFLSRFIYKPINYKVLGVDIKEDQNNYTDTTIQKRNIISFALYEEELSELFDFSKDHGSYMLAITQPLNLDIAPLKSCEGSFPKELKDKYAQVVMLIKNKDFKAAYGISKEIVLIASNNAKALFIHGKIAKSLGKIKEAKEYLKLSSAYDCRLWRGNIVYNSILRKVAAQKEIALFDFQKLIESEWTQNITFMDDVYPQGVYFEKLSIALAARLKKLLKL